MTNSIIMKPTNTDYANNHKIIKFAESNGNLPDTEISPDEFIPVGNRDLGMNEGFKIPSKKIPSINNITIVQQKSLFEKALAFGKFAITEPITLYAMLLGGSYVLKPLAPLAIFGSGLYGLGKISKGILPTKNENKDCDEKTQKVKNIGKGSLVCGLSLIYSNKALKIARISGLKELGSIKDISKLNLLKSFKKCVEITPETIMLASSRFKKAILSLGIAKAIKKFSPKLIKLTKTFL